MFSGPAIRVDVAQRYAVSRRICVTGSRNCHDYAHVTATLDALHAANPIIRLAHGACRGADALCKAWAMANGVEEKGYPYLSRFGAAGGPIRNRQMLEAERPDLLVWFPGNTGTNGCKAIATSLGIPLWPPDEK